MNINKKVAELEKRSIAVSVGDDVAIAFYKDYDNPTTEELAEVERLEAKFENVQVIILPGETHTTIKPVGVSL